MGATLQSASGRSENANRRREALARIVGADAELRAVLARAERVAPTRVPVLVSGESGTGKELLARALHDLGPRPSGPFVAVNCGTLPRDLAESELFGHERGAFTGAGARRIGWFEEAHGGTLVLDEVGELPLALQPKLLRVLESGRLRRVGGTGEVAVDVRVVAMTLRDLRQEIAGGGFRVDLYHRLAGLELTLPPLRRRRADIPALARLFLDELGDEPRARALTPEAVDRLLAHDWPGNVRELRNVIRRAAILCPCPEAIDVDGLGLPAAVGYAVGAAAGGGADGGSGGVPRLCDGDAAALPSGASLPAAPVGAATATAAPMSTAAATATGRGGAGDLLSLEGRTFEDIERAVLLWALGRAGGSRRRAARALAIARSTFCDKVRRYQLG